MISVSFPLTAYCLSIREDSVQMLTTEEKGFGRNILVPIRGLSVCLQKGEQAVTRRAGK